MINILLMEKYIIYNNGYYGSIEKCRSIEKSNAIYASGYWGEQIFWTERNK